MQYGLSTKARRSSDTSTFGTEMSLWLKIVAARARAMLLVEGAGIDCRDATARWHCQRRAHRSSIWAGTDGSRTYDEKLSTSRESGTKYLVMVCKVSKNEILKGRLQENAKGKAKSREAENESYNETPSWKRCRNRNYSVQVRRVGDAGVGTQLGSSALGLQPRHIQLHVARCQNDKTNYPRRWANHFLIVIRPGDGATTAEKSERMRKQKNGGHDA